MTDLRMSIAESAADLAAATALRRRVFVQEGGARPGVEIDRFDRLATHLILRDPDRSDHDVVGTLRLARGAAYTGQEFDLSGLGADPSRLGEIGRLCLDRDYRGGAAAMVLLAGALERSRRVGIDLIVGTGSFPGAEPGRHLPALRALRDAALAPPALRPIARRGPGALDVSGPGRASDMAQVPSLLKLYLRAGAFVGQGAWIDRAFNTVDVCIVAETARLRLPDAAWRLRASA